MAFFEASNSRVQEIKKIKITESDIEFLGALSQTIELIIGQTKEKSAKKILHEIEIDAANLSMSFSANGHLDPRNNLAGSLSEFKLKFDNFVESARYILKNSTILSSTILAKEFLETFTAFQ